MSSRVSGAWRDWAGVGASVGCAVHCAAMPFVVASLPAMGLSFLAGEGFHQWMAVACFLIAVAAFVPGWRKHRQLLPLAIAAFGLVLISGAAFGLIGDGCESCVVESDSASAGVGGQEAVAGSLPRRAAMSFARHGTARFVPWVTSLGGFLLVYAHLLNQNYVGLWGMNSARAGNGRVRCHPVCSEI